MPDRAPWRAELRAMVSLAGPVVLAELGWMAMSTVDTLMVGRLGAEAIGAVSIGSALYLFLAVLAMGVLLGLDTVVAQAFGAGRLDECHRALWQGIHLSLVFTPVVMATSFLVSPRLAAWGVDAAVAAEAGPYLDTVALGTLPLLLYSTFRRYLQAMGLVRPVTVALLTANGVNVLANWALVFGNAGAPALGVEGAGWATFVSRTTMALGLGVYIVARERRTGTGALRVPRAPSVERLVRLVRLGLPAAVQLVLEVGVFAVATTLAGRLDAASLAAHQIALTVASLTFMVPLGVSSAGAVRVGQAVGRGEPGAARRAGWTALALGAGFMSLAALAFVLAPAAIVRAFTDEAAVLAVGVRILLVAAVFQLMDGVQVVATGILRGLGDTATPMIANLVGHWLLGLPVGYALCFAGGRGVVGLWIGLCLGLVSVGAVLLAVWHGRVRRLEPLGAAARPSPRAAPP